MMYSQFCVYQIKRQQDHFGNRVGIYLDSTYTSKLKYCLSENSLWVMGREANMLTMSGSAGARLATECTIPSNLLRRTS